MGIFERLFKKKASQTPATEKRGPVSGGVRRPVRAEEDTSPIKLPIREEDRKAKAVRFETRPTAPMSQVAETGRSIRKAQDIAMHDEEIDEAIDSSFDELFAEDGAPTRRPDLEGKYALSETELARDKDETRELFAQIAVNYIRPLKQFMFELSRGSASSDWIPICLPAVQSLISAMMNMKLTEEAEVLDIFKLFLEELQSRDLRVISGDSQQVALDLYSHLEEILPQTFLLGDEGLQREGIIIFSLMKQIPEVGKVTLDKLIAAGLSTLDMLYLATPDDLARTTGIPLRISERICEKIEQYRKETESRPVDRDQTSMIRLMITQLDDLERHHAAYEELISIGWNDPEFNQKKKQLRTIRQETSLKINVLLAELGEIGLVEEVEKLPFDTRIERLKQFSSTIQKEKEETS
ncbi:hypothetical protein JXQ70_01825 [bacterium]|nr:hypothetical protein [bacterium]